MARPLALVLLLAAGCTPEPAIVAPPGAVSRSWVLPPAPPAPVPLTAEERRRLEAEWPPVWFPPEWDLAPERREVVPRVRLVHPPVGAAPRQTVVLQARSRPEAVVLRADGGCEPCPDARPTLRAARLGRCDGGSAGGPGDCPGPTPTPPGR